MVKVLTYLKENENADIIRLGIGDVTRPMPKAITNAIKKAAEELEDEKTFRGYGPEQGYDFLKEKIINSDSSEVLGEKGDLETDFYSKIRATVSSEINQGLAQYLDYGLNRESQLYLATALSFRKYIRSISWEFLHNLTNLSPEQYRLLNAYIKSLNYAPLKGALPDCSISDELKGLYLESLGIEADSSMSVIAYIQQVLDNLKNIVKILYSTNNCNSLIYNVFMHNNVLWSNSNAFSLMICKVYTKRENAGS